MPKLIILNQRIKDWEVKGEIQENYFNPEYKFEKIIIISLVHSESPSNSSLKKLCGSEKFQYFNINSFLLRSNFFKYILPNSLYKFLIFRELNSLDLSKVKTIHSIGDGFPGLIAGIISKKLACRLIISVHSYVNLSIFLKYLSFKEKVFYLLNLRFKEKSHKLADQIKIVYKIIEENINSKYTNKIKISYNNIKIKNNHRKKQDLYKTHLNLVFVGRLIKGKSLTNIILSIKDLNNVILTIFGDGPERQKIELMIQKYKLEKRIILEGYRDNEYI